MHKKDDYILQNIANHLIINCSFSKNIGLLYGTMGIIIFFYHYARYSKNRVYEEFAETLLNDFAEQIHSHLPIDFENGYLGIGWGIKYLGHQKFINEENMNSILEDIDKKIMERDLRRCVDTSLNQGLEGIFHYILFRLYNSKTTTFDLTYLSELFSSANKLKEYCTNSDSLFLINQYIQWFQNRELEYECTILFRKLYTKGHYKYSNINEWELGIANGYAGLGLNIMKI